MDDIGLVAAAQAGDEDAFAALYQEHHEYVRAVGRSMLRAEDLDDFCQETFLLAFTRLQSFSGTAGFRTWITRIAINQGLLLLRRGRQDSNGDERLVQMDFEEMEDDERWSTRDVRLEGVAWRLDAEHMLRVLQPVQRQIIELAYLEEMPDLEIAETLGMSVPIVDGIRRRGKVRLRKELENKYRHRRGFWTESVSK